MKKSILFFGSIFISLLMISTVTAVPKVNSDPLMDKIQELEEIEKMILDKLDVIKTDVDSGGIIDLLIQIIQWLIDVIMEIFGLVSLIETLVNLIVQLFTVIINLINYIIDIFTPGITY